MTNSKSKSNLRSRCSKLRRKGLAVLLAVLTVTAITVMPATPALAEEAGKGRVLNGTWEDHADSAGSNAAVAAGCYRLNTDTRATWNQAGTYTVGDGTAVYAGPTTVVMTSTGNYRWDPMGSYGPTANCSGTLGMNQPVPPGVPGYVVPETRISVTGYNSVDKSAVNCDYVTGSFSRTATAVTITATGTCTVDPSGPAAVVSDGNVALGWVLETATVPRSDAVLSSPVTGGTYCQRDTTCPSPPPPPPAPSTPNTCEDLANAANDEPFVNEQLPAECVKQAKYVALGDSYSSGEGLAESANLGTGRRIPDLGYAQDSTSNSDYPNCHRHPNSYPSVFAHDHFAQPDEYLKAADFAFYACSGAWIEDIANPPVRDKKKMAMNMVAQIDHEDIGEETELVSLTIGGNSAGFAKVVTACVVGHVATSAGPIDLGDAGCWALIQATRSKVNGAEFRVKLETAFQAIKGEVSATTTRIIALGYPHFFPSSSPNFLSGQSCPKLRATFDKTNQDEINEGIDDVNSQISAAAAATGIEYEAVQDRWTGYEICGTEGEEWINHVTWRDNTDSADASGVVGEASFHPNDSGHIDGYAEELKGAVG